MAVKQRLRKRARRDVRSAYAPAINAVDRAIGSAEDDYRFRDEQVQNIYSGLQDIMQPQGPRYDRAVEGIMGDYTKALGDFSSAFSDSFAPAEAIGGAVGEQAAKAARAAANAYGTIGTGGIKLLGDARERNANYFGRMNVVGGLAEKDARFNQLSEYEQLLDDLKNRRLDLSGEKSSAILTRLDELRQQRQDNRLARKQFQLNKEQIENQQELSDYLIGHIGSEAERRRRAAARRRQQRQNTGGGGGKDSDAHLHGWERTGGSASSGGGGSKGPSKGEPGIPQGPGYARQKAVKRYDALTERLQDAHGAVEGEWYDPASGKWYVGGIPYVSTVGATPVAEINRPLRKRRRIVKRNPDLEGRAGG